MTDCGIVSPLQGTTATGLTFTPNTFNSDTAVSVFVQFLSVLGVSPVSSVPLGFSCAYFLQSVIVVFLHYAPSQMTIYCLYFDA
jgi:hypothetical protein